MARKRTTPVQPTGKEPRADGRKKFQMYLPAALIKQLHHLAVDEERDIGSLAEPKMRELVGKRYQPHRRGDGEPADSPAVRLAPPPEQADRPDAETEAEADDAA